MFAGIFWWGTLHGICVYSVSGSNGDTRIGNRCIEDLSRSFTVPLQCPAGEWIHVVHKMYGNGDAATCRLTSSEFCGKIAASSRNGLIVSCNGKHSCFEIMQVQSIDNCNVTGGAAEIKYNCIKGSRNMCIPLTTTVNGSVYLHSPGFPDSVGMNSSCVVRIRGHHIHVQVTLVEARMRSGMLNISGDGKQLWTNVNVNQYNRALPGQAAEIVIVYDNHDQDGSNLWIRVVGSGQLDIAISRDIQGASTTPTSTQQSSRLQSRSGPSNSETSTTETTARAHPTAIASFATVTSTRSTGKTATQSLPRSTDTSNSGDVVTALSVVCGILVLIIVILVVYFMVVKPFRKKHDTSSNTGTSVEHGETNVYDGIQRGTSEAGDEHNYGQITSSGGPVYVNAVKGDDP